MTEPVQNGSPIPPSAPAMATGSLVIDLARIAENYQRLCSELGDVACGACVKANGYGLGARTVGATLWNLGCRDFFVAIAAEGIELRSALPDARIHVFAGIASGTPDAFVAHNLIPVLNSLEDVATWRQVASHHTCDLHVDTGMSRLGFDQGEMAAIETDPSLIGGLEVDLVMSHLASADDESSNQSASQRTEFDEACQTILNIHPNARRSLANSSGVFLGPDYHYDLARPGAAIYGINPTPWTASPMRQTIHLKGKILQTRFVDTPRTVGYGASHTVSGPTRLATVGAGYADGYLRSLSGNGTAWLRNVEVPIVGRVSMDMITIDISALADQEIGNGEWVTLIGGEHDTDATAREAGTIGYEILTSLGRRYQRRYINGDALAEGTP